MLEKLKALPQWAFVVVIAVSLVVAFVVGIVAYQFVIVPILAVISGIAGLATRDIDGSPRPQPDPRAEARRQAEEAEAEAERNMRLRALRMARERRDAERRHQERRERKEASEATDEALVEDAVSDAKKLLQ